MEDYVDAGAELLHILWAESQARLCQLTADGDDLLIEVWVVLPYTVEKLQDRQRKTRFLAIHIQLYIGDKSR